MADNVEAENKPAGQVSTTESKSSSEKLETSESKTNGTDTQQAKNSAPKESEKVESVNLDKPDTKKSKQYSKKSNKGSKKNVKSECDKSDTSTSEQETNSPMQSKDSTVPNTRQDTAREGNASNNSPDHAEESDEDDEGIGLGDCADMDSDSRNKMFEKGLNFEKNGKRNRALKCYLACLTGLKPDTRFPLLPQCLRNIADIFYHKEEYDKAVHFIQAEKVYYESALIDTTDIQHKLEEAQLKGGTLQPNMTTDTVRASEYEHLARLCLDREQPQLALEYAGKATKLRQQVLGDKDPVTVESLDFFATVYAKVGAEQYEESLKKFADKPEEGDDAEGSPQTEDGEQKEPVSILRKRKISEKEKKVHFDESQLQSNEQIQHEEKFAKTVLWALLVVCCILLIILGLYLYCNLVGSNACTKLKSDLHYGYMRLKYWYYQYQAGPNAKFM
ncbi:consortin-like [Mytilus trossulus]|uniref:consortin-like n=1 Tax=Mytilus trossulus TaxID=6551 RepID=UPI0030065C4A